MDRLMTMTTFSRVVKYSSFTAAAEELGISRALVSRHIIDLEAHFGVRLLNRTTRSVTPTEAGLRYYDLCNRILAELRTGEDAITAIKTNIEGNISILCPKWVGNFDISEAVVDFCRENPGVSVQLHIGEISSNPHDFLDKGFDISIQANRMRNSEIMAKKIGEIEYVLVATPAYLSARGEPQTIKDLSDHDLLTKLSESSWLFDSGERIPFRGQPTFSSNSYLSLCTAAVGGLGIAMLPRRVAAMDMRDGNLQQILMEMPLERRPLYAAFSPGGDVPRKVRVLISFLSDWFKKRSQFPDHPGRVLQMSRDRPAEIVTH